MNDTINLTPQGMLSQEGIERVNAEMKLLEQASNTVANAATEFFREQRITLLEVARGSSIAEDDRAALREALHQLDAIIGARTRRQEAFLRTVAGQPPAPLYVEDDQNVSGEIDPRAYHR
jgi:hypothetical protein